jgi:cell division transport system ATP-binding protein
MIKISDVTKAYDKEPILKNLTLNVERGELSFITGPSGAGKSTLLKLIYCSEQPDNGQITVADNVLNRMKQKAIAAFRRNIGIVFQDFKLLDNKTVFENVALALRVRKMNPKAIRSYVTNVLKEVNLSHKAKVLPPYLSGGEQQRVVVARAMVTKPMLLLADEPTGNLDNDNEQTIMKLFREINARGTTVLIATHNESLYTGSGRRVLIIKDKYIDKEIMG